MIEDRVEQENDGVLEGKDMKLSVDEMKKKAVMRVQNHFSGKAFAENLLQVIYDMDKDDLNRGGRNHQNLLKID